MRAFPLLVTIFLLAPLLEIYLLLKMGSVIGVGWTIFLVVLTAVVGAFLVRAQGFATYMRVQESLQRQQMPAMELLEGLVLLIAGALLLTPGFATDAVGFACLTPPLRRGAIRYILKRGVFAAAGESRGARSTQASARTLDGQFRRVDDRVE